MTVDDLRAHERMRIYEYESIWYAVLYDQAARVWEGTGSCPSEAVDAVISEYRKAHKETD